MLWNLENMQRGGHLSIFVDKAMKLLDLRQVMMEVETSVMSRVSCTACKVGAGLLQNYIKSGKSDEEIMNSIYQFCVSLNIQSSRVCQGVTLLFGVSTIFNDIYFKFSNQIFPSKYHYLEKFLTSKKVSAFLGIL